MRFKQFFLEQFIENSIGVVYVDPSPEEFYKHVIQNIDAGSTSNHALGVLFSPSHTVYFDRREMVHVTCYNKFMKGRFKTDAGDVLPATVVKKGFGYTIFPAYFTLKEMNFLGYNDLEEDENAKSTRKKSPKGQTYLQKFLTNGGSNRIESIVQTNPHLTALRTKKPLGYNIRVDYSEALN